MAKKSTNTRTFRGQPVKGKDIENIVLVEHNFEDDFTEQDCDLHQFLNIAKDFKLAATFQNNIKSPLIWEPTYDQNVKDVLYIISIENKIVKYGMTETSLYDRHGSLLTGQEKYAKNNTNSTTNVKSFKLIQNALSKGKKVCYYTFPLPVHAIENTSFDGKTYIDYVAATRENERRLHECIAVLTNNVQPILNTQVPGGKKKKV